MVLLAACGEPQPIVDHHKLLLARSQASTAAREWRYYLGDKSSSQYSPLSEINRDNVHRLELVWQYDASAGRQELEGESQHNPLIVQGVLYGVAAGGGRVFALNAATGEEIWAWEPPETLAQVSRGLVYWSDPATGDERIFFGSGSFIHALDARSGSPVRSFAEQGAIDLRKNLVDEGREFDFVAATTPGIIYRDLLIQGMRVNEFSGAAPGHIRAYDIRNGELRWRFDTIPKDNSFGAETWPPGASASAGGANSWAGMSLDEDRGLVFIPTGSATMDTYGADRPGDNLFANTLLALDAATGERRWHYQVVRHDLWDRDLPSPPNLVTIQHNGQPVDAVVQATKSGHLFVFNRDTGEPLYPIIEVPVSGTPLPGEVPAASQPIPTLPEPFAIQGLDRNGLDQRSSAQHRELSARLARYQHEGIYNLPSLAGSILRPGFDGGANWGGSAWDPERGLLYVNATEIASVLQMIPVPGTRVSEAMTLGAVYGMACAQCHGDDRRGGGAVPSLRGIGTRLPPWDMYDIILNGRGRMPPIDHRMGKLGALATMAYLYTAGDSDYIAPAAAIGSSYSHVGYPDFIAADNLPATRPPWGTLNAIDLATGKIRWRIPLGDFPQVLAAGEQGKGAINYGGPVATAGGLVFIGATPDARFRAFDSDSGELLWETELPTGGFATPATYEAAGRQYVVINASGTKLGTHLGKYYLAFTLKQALPDI